LLTLPEYDEKGLLQLVSEGDESAFRELFHRHADSLGSFIFRLTRSTVSAEEIVQEVFLKIWTTRTSLKEVDNFRAYLFVLSRNQTLNAMRKTARELNRQKQWEAHQAAQQQVEENETFPQLEAIVDNAIRHLPPQQQSAWLLSRKDGLSHQQIATTMGLSRETVKKYIMYANQSLTRFIRSHSRGNN